MNRVFLSSMLVVLGAIGCGGATTSGPDLFGKSGEEAVGESSSALDVSFGAPEGAKTGAAVFGNTGDFWNTVSVPWNDDHTERGLLAPSKSASPIRIRMQNLGGQWGQPGKLALGDRMLENYNYPANNKGGDSFVTLESVPAGMYTLVVFGTSSNPDYYGDYAVSAGGQDYGRKRTKSGSAAASATTLTEGLHFVRFDGLQVKSGDAIEIHIRPGGVVSDGAPGPNGTPRTFQDAYICGIQLAPVTPL